MRLLREKRAGKDPAANRTSNGRLFILKQKTRTEPTELIRKEKLGGQGPMNDRISTAEQVAENDVPYLEDQIIRLFFDPCQASSGISKSTASVSVSASFIKARTA